MRRTEFLAGAMATGFALTTNDNASKLRLDAAPLAHDIDPYRDAEFGADELSWLYADGLVGWQHGPVPLLADLPEEKDGGLRYHYRLRRATWHDGRPFRAHDVAGALDAIRATPFGTRNPYRSVTRLVIGGDHDFDVVLSTPQRQFSRSFFGAYGAPALPVIRRSADGVPLGTGPFAVRAHAEAGRWRLARTDGSPRGTPLLDEVELRLLTSDMTANVRLLSGEADIALPLAPRAIESELFRRVERTTSTAVLLLNARTAFAEFSTRLALAGAIDVVAVQRAYDRRRTNLLASLLIDGENDRRFADLLSRNPAAAAVLREHLRQIDLTIAYVAESPSHQRTALMLQQELRAVGVASSLHPAPGVAYLGAEGPLRRGRFDIAIFGFVYGAEPDLAADWSCGVRPPRGGNFSQWCDSGFESAATRRDGGAMLRDLYDSVACIPLSRAYEEIGVARRVGGFVAPEPLTPATYGCAGWWVA